MSDNFSLDDILAEIDAKKAEKSGEKPKSEVDYTITSIIGADELTKAIKESEKKKKQRSAAQSEEKPKAEKKAAISPVQKKQVKEKAAPTPAPKKQAEEKAAPLPVPKKQAEEKAAPPPVPKKQAEEKAAPLPAPEKQAEEKTVKAKAEEPKQAQPEKQEKTEKAEKPEKPKKVSPNTQQRKLIESQLRAEESFENPEELIDAINPYEVRSKAADFGALMGGDTRGLAGNELKKLAEIKERTVDTEEVKLYKGSESMIASAATIETTAPVKEYTPKKEKEQEKAKAKEPPRKMTEKERRSNEALLEKLNLAISRKREEEEIRRTAGLSAKIENLKPPTQGLNIDYSGKVIQATGVLPDESELYEADKGKAKRKLRDFVMDEGSEED